MYAYIMHPPPQKKIIMLRGDAPVSGGLVKYFNKSCRERSKTLLSIYRYKALKLFKGTTPKGSNVKHRRWEGNGGNRCLLSFHQVLEGSFTEYSL